jgi:hypothetical protein
VRGIVSEINSTKHRKLLTISVELFIFRFCVDKFLFNEDIYWKKKMINATINKENNSWKESLKTEGADDARDIVQKDGTVLILITGTDKQLNS